MNRIVRSLAVGFSLLLASNAFADKPALGNGNFRRAEALRVAGAKNTSTTRVVGLTTSNHRIETSGKNYKQSRILFVEHATPSNGLKVDVVRAPLNKSQPVTKMTKSQVHEHGLITQGEAKQQAKMNGGELAGHKTPALANAGIGAKEGSYKFTQTSPKSVTAKQYGEKYRVSGITRTVSVTGKGESAQGAKWQRLSSK